MTYPKILFLTVNGWNNTTGTGTISSIIEGYPKECVANIFIRADRPNSSVCDKYFRIDELKVIKSVFKRNIKTGYPVNVDTQNQINFEKERKEQIALKKRKNAIIPFIRDFVWKIGVWKTKELREFVTEFNPDFIIFPAEGLIHFNNIGRYISKLCNKPIGLMFWDDNFTYIPQKTLISKAYRFLQRKNIKKIAKESIFSFAFSKKMQEECIEHLNIKPVLITRPMVKTVNSTLYKHSEGVIKILYTGSIYIGRGETILQVIESIKEINATGQKFFLEIYTNSALNEEEKAMYNVEGVSKLYPPVSKEEVISLQQNSDILLFAEALNGKYKDAARLSFSTKIIDYISSRRCILAVGPSDISSMEYFTDNNIAIIANTKNQIIDALKTISEKPEIMTECAERSYKFAISNHDKNSIYKIFENTVHIHFN